LIPSRPPAYYAHGDAERSSYVYRSPSHYAYGHAGLGWSRGPWQVELDRIATHPDMQRPNSRLTASPWIATISRSF
jgi:hypothetical protein